jgi:uncharacterized protein YhfF
LANLGSLVVIPERTALPEADRSAAAAFWQRYLAAVGEESGADFTDVACFGDSVELADELIDLVVRGQKRATAGSLAEYESEGVAVPKAGDRWIACDGRGRPRAVIRTTEVRVGPLSSVDDQFAWDEGEGDRTKADWLRNHTAYFTRLHASLGVPFLSDIPVAFERFEVAYQESNQEPD